MSATSETAAPSVAAQIRESRVLATTIRVIDFALAALLLLVVLPVLLTAALAIRLTSPGPAIFRQKRLGVDGKPFTVFKFRTMVAGAKETRHQEYVRQLISGTERTDDRHDLYKLVIDDRITPVGRLLRQTSLDELPQFWNVIRGEMSLVGPRPVIPYEAEIYPDWYRERFAVKPGITGLWQVSGRNRRTYEEMIELDIQYVRQRTVGLYLGILARTVPAVLLRRGVA